MIYLDTETCGLHGPVVLIQYAENDGPIILHDVWKATVKETTDVIEKFCNDPDGIVGFNLSFDWFHCCQIYTVLDLISDKDAILEDCIEEYAELEPLGRDGPCLKPKSACDLMLFARKGPYQSTMDRGDIRIRKVPTPLAWQLASELEKRIPLKDIYFARRKDKFKSKWQIYDIEDDDGEIDQNFKDIVLKFAPSSALKALATDALNLEPDSVLLFADIDIDPKFYPVELGYAPFAKAIGNRHNWKGAWPSVIKQHITHWAYSTLARKYAALDVQYTRDLYKHFGSPTLGDDDSILACCVAAVRWKGYKVDLPGLKKLCEDTKARNGKKIIDGGREFKIPTAPAPARYYVTELMDETEKLIIAGSTKKVLLQEIAKWKRECPDCKGIIVQETNGLNICTKCKKGLIEHPAASRAQEVLDARQCNYEIDLYEKFLLAGRFHASFIVIGALSSRMSGTDGLNAQGVKKTKEVRGQFPLAWTGATLCGGDFSGFEVTLAEACYGDPDLRRDLQSGKKIHALFGVHVFPDMTYEEILKSEGTKNDVYTKCKQAVFAMFYGGEGFTLKDRLGVDIETADKAYAEFCKKYKMVGVQRKKIADLFCSMKQVGGIGSKIEWREPADKIESMFGFPRYFTLENQICRTLFEIANKPPKSFQNVKLRVQRRAGRVQTAGGATQTALYAAAFALQASNTRAALNHVIQSSGATITKKVQRDIWDIQPHGVNKWIVQPCNIHDEIMCPTLPDYTAKVKEIVDKAVESFRPTVPLIKMDWVTGLKTWAEKG